MFTLRFRFLLLTVLLWQGTASAAETCGNLLDDDADNLLDDGCFPAGVTGVCESPLGCGLVGAVAPRTGALEYGRPSDLSVKAAFSMPLAFTRFYTSQYEPGYTFPSATNHEAPLGYRWQHNWMSFLERQSTTKIAVHLTTGQDVLFTVPRAT